MQIGSIHHVSYPFSLFQGQAGLFLAIFSNFLVSASQAFAHQKGHEKNLLQVIFKRLLNHIFICTYRKDNNMMDVETEVKDIKRYVIEISKKLDELLYEKEIISMMKLAEKSLSGFLEDEPDIYKIEDLKVRYK